MKKETYFVDVDGTILKYVPFEELSVDTAEALPGVVDWINEKRSEGHMIVLTTARPETYKGLTIAQMFEVGIRYDKLIMGLNRGVRYLVNDVPTEYESPLKAVAINVNRDEGFENI